MPGPDTPKLITTGTVETFRRYSPADEAERGQILELIEQRRQTFLAEVQPFFDRLSRIESRATLVVCGESDLMLWGLFKRKQVPAAKMLPDGPPSRVHLGRPRTPTRRRYVPRPEFHETNNRGPDEVLERPMMFRGGRVQITRAEEMQYFEMLGPEVRGVLNDAFFRWSTLDVLREMRRRGLDPDNQIHDMKMAYEVEKRDGQSKYDYLLKHGGCL